jgi:uncharacterized protein involved in exopolysaccharide biosynthesis
MQPTEQISDEISLKELIQKLGEWWKYLLSKWLVIVFCAMVGGGIGLLYAFIKKPEYKAVITFALEDDKQGGGGLSGALGLASSLGIDLGTSAGGAFSGSNLIELMKSRKMVQKALLNAYIQNGHAKSLADQLLEMTEINKKLIKKGIWKGESLFQVNADPSGFNLQQDSVISVLYELVIGSNGILSVAQKDKKISIISVNLRKTMSHLHFKKFN